GTVYAAALETPVGECIFHLGDGRRQRLRLLYGAHLATCISEPGKPVPSLREGTVAWSSTLSDGTVARLYQCTWRNPAPDQLIESVDFLAGSGNAGPILVAMSVEKSL